MVANFIWNINIKMAHKIIFVTCTLLGTWCLLNFVELICYQYHMIIPRVRLPYLLFFDTQTSKWQNLQIRSICKCEKYLCNIFIIINNFCGNSKGFLFYSFMTEFLQVIRYFNTWYIKTIFLIDLFPQYLWFMLT